MSGQTRIQKYVDPGFDEIYVHNCGRNQEEFVKAYGERVIPSPGNDFASFFVRE